MLQHSLLLTSVALAAALSSGCAWRGGPPAIKAANAAPDACETDPDFPDAMECGRSKGYVTLGVLLAVAGLATVVFTHTGLK